MSVTKYNWLLFFVLSVAITGCLTPKNISKDKSPEEIIPQIRAKRTYLITTNSGQRVMLKVVKVDSLKVYGFISYNNSDIRKAPYEENLKNLIQNSEKISIKRFNPAVFAIEVVVVASIGFIIFLKSF